MNVSSLKKELNLTGEKIYNEYNLYYSNHLFDIIRDLKLDESSLITGFFARCDLENNGNKEIITAKYDNSIVERIQLIQRISSLNIPDTKKRIGNLRRLFINLTNDLLIIFVKLAERLTALELAERDNSGETEQLAEECLYLYSPIAHRLGIRKIYSQMEDIAFRVLYPKEFKRLHRVIEKNRKQYERKLAEMKLEIKNLLQKNGVQASLQSRVKKLYSIYRKIQNKGINLNEIYDLLALRVITKSPDSCYLTLGFVHSKWIPIEGRFRDWITFPKPNGYRSIQTTVHTRSGDKFEIQIRTEQMHQEAEYGSAAHWAYKEGVTAQDESIMRLKEFLENDEYFDNPYELLEMLKAEMKQDYINVLTPKGDIKSLPKGATPVDFAFSVHTDVGLKVTGARINGKFAKLKSALHAGDVIDIITRKDATPSRDWLTFVKTTRAKSKIIRWFKKNEEQLLINDGRKIFDKLLKRYKNNLKGIDKEESLKDNLLKIGYKTPDEFYIAIAGKYIKSSKSLLQKLYPAAFKSKKASSKSQLKDSPDVKKEPAINVEGMKGIKTQLAKCCNPVKGEDIIAYVTKKSTIKIHRSSCPYLKGGSIDSDNLKKAEWGKGSSEQIVKVRIYADNYQVILDALENLTENSSLKVGNVENISSLSKGNAGAIAGLIITDINQLGQFTAKLKLLKGIRGVKKI